MCRFLLLVYFLSPAICSDVLSRRKRVWIVDSFEVEEEHPGPFPFVLGKIRVDRKYEVLFELTGEGVDEEPRGLVSIERHSGTLYIHGPLDYEDRTLLKLRFEARKADQSTDTRLGVEVQVRDINDNPPRFQRDVYEVSVTEETAQGSHLLTVQAYDRDRRGTPNSTFHYQIKSVTPNIPDTEFFIDENGAISFRGCLNYKAADKVRLLVEAKDHGEVVSLSSSTTVVIHVQDGNNHRPFIRGTTGTSRVKEHQTGSAPLRLHVTDMDAPNTPAWRAKFALRGDEGGHFRIETDPHTNDGVLTVIKPLDFERDSQQELSISVENESPYFSCKVQERRFSDLWKVDVSTGEESGAGQPHSVQVVIDIEDVNDPPGFSVPDKETVLEENVPVGTWVEKLTAVDPDLNQDSGFIYKVGHDPAGWLTVDPRTGDITTVKSPDRESLHVVNGVYTFILHAVDNGEPAMTGTATLRIHVKDQNDHVPRPAVDHVSICLSPSPSITNITALDGDASPFGGPFTFELLGEGKEKWALHPTHGFTTGLSMGPSVYAGQHSIELKISDIQGKFGVYSLSVTACDCSVTRDCRDRRAAATQADSAAVGVVLASVIFLLALLLAALICSCKEEFVPLKVGDASGQSLITSNTETPGTDCKLPDRVPMVSDWKHGDTSLQPTGQNLTQDTVSFQQEIRRSQQTSNTYNQFDKVKLHHETMGRESDAILATLLERKLASLQETENDVTHDAPHPYAEEGSSGIISDLEDLQFSDL